MKWRVALVVWTVFVWIGRIRLLSALSPGEWTGLVMAIAMLGLAGYAAFNREGVRWLAWVSIVLWGVRLPLVLLHHHSISFKMVHLALGLVSLALAGLALVEQRERTKLAERVATRFTF